MLMPWMETCVTEERIKFIMALDARVPSKKARVLGETGLWSIAVQLPAGSRRYKLFVFGLFFFVVLVDDLLLDIWRGGVIMA